VVDEPILAELTKWTAEMGNGKTSIPRPKGLPKALNAKVVWLALGLGADLKPDALPRQGLKALLQPQRIRSVNAKSRPRRTIIKGLSRPA
jgi:hypothetical protein